MKKFEYEISMEISVLVQKSGFYKMSMCAHIAALAKTNSPLLIKFYTFMSIGLSLVHEEGFKNIPKISGTLNVLEFMDI